MGDNFLPTDESILAETEEKQGRIRILESKVADLQDYLNLIKDLDGTSLEEMNAVARTIREKETQIANLKDAIRVLRGVVMGTEEFWDKHTRR